MADNIKKYQKRAWKYYDSCGIVPDEDDIDAYVADCIVDETGMDYDQAYEILDEYKEA